MTSTNTLVKHRARPLSPLPRMRDGSRTTRSCGWCHSSQTSQWRVGQRDGSAAMSILCNACGLNYRRAARSNNGHVDLDALARFMEKAGTRKLSICKSLKRQRYASSFTRIYDEETTLPPLVQTKTVLPSMSVLLHSIEKAEQDELRLQRR